ncbi:odorant receptor Or2-like [Schistocerca gregaria]|uniref:odorant receptor Or2-like n=1 Tax=Schistocerca gregaria TaxID=7010 RepID=UPI00211EAACD|nr:odorant receptor Or2-like [Schistocerca gregaria]
MQSAPVEQPAAAAAAAAAAQDACDLDYLLTFLHWTGTMRHPRAGPLASRAYRAANAAVTMAFVYFVCSQAVILFRGGTSDFDSFTLTLSLIDTQGTWLVRIRHIAALQPQFHRLAYQVSAVGRDFGQFASAEDVAFLRAGSRRMRVVMLLYLAFGLGECCVWLTAPASETGLPFVLALPYDVTRPVAYVATAVYCCFITLHTIMANFAADAFNASLIVQLRMQLTLLSRNIINCNNVTEKPYSLLDKAESVDGVRPCQTFSTSDVYYRLQKNILHHQAIIRNVELLQRCLGSILLGQSLSIGISVCFQLYQVAKNAESLQDAGKYSSYLFTMFAELFVYCWFADDLISESENVAQAAYDAVPSLLECPTSIKRSLLILMQRAQRPLSLTAAGLFPLSRESFVSIVNVSYSFFAILRNFKED